MAMLTESHIDSLETPLGSIVITASKAGITHVSFSQPPLDLNPNALTESCKQQLEEYFKGNRKVFELPLAPTGTDFQRSVWSCLQKIPFGQTCCYLDIAQAANSPKAFRAVGSANSKNPISIIVPCHRVIGRKGTLSGYSWGLEKKRWLLKHEGIDEDY